MSKPHKKVLTFGTDTAKPEIGKAGNVASNPVSVRFPTCFYTSQHFG